MVWDDLEQRKVKPPFKPRVVSFTSKKAKKILKIKLKICRGALVMQSILTQNLLARSPFLLQFRMT